MPYCFDCNSNVPQTCLEQNKLSCPDYRASRKEDHKKLTDAGHGDLFKDKPAATKSKD